MLNVKGFATNAKLIKNSQGIVSPIGELSTQALTYTREKGYYSEDALPEIELVTFIAKKDDTTIVLDDNTRNHILSIVDSVYTKVLASGTLIYADELLVDLIRIFDKSADNFKCGEIVSDGTFYCPEWLSWHCNDSAIVGLDSVTNLANANEIKIWFADGAFKAQFEDFEITVVPPLARVDDFFKTPSEIAKLLAAQTPSDVMVRVQDAKQNSPETIIRADTFDYVDPLNAQHKISTTWNLLIYGANGNNVDAISDRLVEYILANSTHTRQEWMQIFPDIFKRTEFLIIPNWKKYAIPNRTIEAGIYSPVYNLKQAVADVKAVAVDYPPEHVDGHATVFGHPYKSLEALCIGSQDNRDNLFEITDVFPDYIAVSSTSTDFNRMALATQNWSVMLASLLIAAETAGVYSNIGLGFTKVKRGNILYIVKRFGNINYLVYAKSNTGAN